MVIFGAAVRPDGRPSGALRGRVEAALETGQRLVDPIYMPTGGQGRYGRPEADVMAEALIAAGVPDAAIWRERTAVNTMRSALACARLLAGSRARVYVATSTYHMVRCVLLLRLAGVRARPGRAPAGGGEPVVAQAVAVAIAGGSGGSDRRGSAGGGAIVAAPLNVTGGRCGFVGKRPYIVGKCRGTIDVR